MDLPVSITDKALQEIKEIKTKKNIPAQYGLRVGIKGAGCAGVSYLLGFDTPRADDQSYELDHNISLHISKKHMMYILGLQLDFHEDEQSRGFLFSNLNQENATQD